MKFCTLFLVIALATAAVVPLTHENFDEVVNGEKNVFVKFYAPWCGHCQQLAPEYELFAEAFAKEDSIIIAEVNADEDRILAERFEISGFPTLKFFPAGAADAPEDYEGGRTAMDLVRYTNEKIGTKAAVKTPVSNVKVLTPENFDEVTKNSGKVVFVKFYAPWCGHCKHLAPTYSKLADVFVEEPSVIIAELDADAHRDIAQQYDVHGYPTLKLFKNGEPIPYQGDRSLENLVEFVNNAAGTARLPDGTVDTSFGRLVDVDKVIESVKELSDENVKTIKEALAKVDDSLAATRKVYESLLKRIQEKGLDYIDTEKARLSKFLMSDSVSKVKKGAFRVRMNVLGAFDALKPKQAEEIPVEEVKVEEEL